MRLAALALAMPASAVPIVDQEALPNGGTLWLEDDTTTRQDFVVSVTGELVAIDLYLVSGS
jgi:hypothetical protein